MTLAETVRAVSERSVEAITADETVRQSLERFVQARSALLPSVEGAFSDARQTRNLRSVGIQPAANSSSSGITPAFTVMDARVSAAQRIFDLGALRRWQLSARDREVAESERNKIQQDVMALAATLYIDARRTREALATSKSILAWSRAAETLMRGRRRIGVADENEIWQARRELAEARAQVRLLRSAVYGKIMELNALLGKEPRTPWIFEDPKPIVSAAFSGESGFGSDLMVAQKHLSRSEALARSADAAFFPQVAFRADYGGNGAGADELETTYSYGIFVTAPFFEGGLRQSQAEEAKSIVRSAQARLDDASRRDIIKKLDARRRLADARMVLMAKETGVSAERAALGFVRSRRASGQASDLDLLQARAGAARAADERWEARAALDQAWVELAHAEGKMAEWVADGVTE